MSLWHILFNIFGSAKIKKTVQKTAFLYLFNTSINLMFLYYLIKNPFLQIQIYKHLQYNHLLVKG